ncbi:hypothetical protein [Melissospora conviva]|uniref:hypothetical protein n=1 Tax=Melissospora conviva TaxID=3388432 RepID=UPI003C21E4B1
MRYVLAALTVVLGVAAFVYGGYDDSPGLQLIGAVLVAGAITFAVRAARHGRRK